MPVHIVFLPAITLSDSPCARNVLSSTELSRSKLKNPMPHKPTTPEKASAIPTSVLRRHRGSVNNSVMDPSLTLCAALSALAFCHASGSFNRRMMTTTSNAGRAPMMNIMRQELAMT